MAGRLSAAMEMVVFDEVQKAMVEGRGMEYQQNELTEDIC